MFTRIRSTPLDDGTTQIDVQFFANADDPDDLCVAAVPYVKRDPDQTIDDFLAERSEDLTARQVYIATLPPPEPGDPAAAPLTLEQRLATVEKHAEAVVAKLVEKGTLSQKDADDVAVAAEVAVAEAVVDGG